MPGAVYEMEVFRMLIINGADFQWPPDLRRVSVAARLLGLRLRIPPGAWMSKCDFRVLSGTVLCVGTVTLS